MNARILALVICVISLAGCASLQQFATGKVADALAGGGAGFGTDEDPDLVATAAPFSLKMMEALLQSTPRHTALLTATAGGFTQYAYAFVQQEADLLESQDVAAAYAARLRARGLYWRGRDYGLRALESRHKGFTAALAARPQQAVAKLDRSDASAIYWTLIAWAASIAVDKDSSDSLAGLPMVDALQARLAALEPDYDSGALDNFLITFEMARPGSRDPAQVAARHFERAVRLTAGRKAAPFVAYAESVSVPQQDREEFMAKLQQALAVDTGARPQWRLENIVMQQRARWLLAQADQLFIDGSDDPVFDDPGVAP